jgi:predicted amidophosphoribosyltransferase
MCDRCNQTGFVTFNERVEYWGFIVSMPVTELCSCLEDATCPVCGRELETLADDRPGVLFCPDCVKSWDTGG